MVRINHSQKKPKQPMAVMKKRHGTTKKYKLFLRMKLETGVSNAIFSNGTHRFCFTNMETCFENGVPNRCLNHY